MFDKITHHFITAIFNRVATGFILCFSEHVGVRQGLGWNLNKLKNLRFPPMAGSEILGVCITNALLAITILVPLRFKNLFIEKLLHLEPHTFQSAIIRSACDATAGSWVTMITVFPASTKDRR